MKAIGIHALTLTLGLLGSACGRHETGSDVKAKALNQDAQVRVVSVKRPGSVNYYLIEAKQYYSLQCDSAAGLEQLLKGTGYPGERIQTWTLDQLRAQDRTEGPRLTCDPAGKTLYMVKDEAKVRYFLSMDSAPTDLHMIGCRGLISGLGLKVENAKLIDAELIKGNPFHASDDDDLSCFDGLPTSDVIAWTVETHGQKPVQVGNEVEFEYAATVNETAVELEASFTPSSTDACKWLTSKVYGKSLVVRGTVPETFRNQDCGLKVKVKNHQDPGNEQSLLLLERTRPVLTSTCAARQDVNSLADFKACQVESSFGLVSISQQSCLGTFSYDQTTKTLSLAALPGAGKSCEVELLSDIHGQKSDPVKIQAVMGCGPGAKLEGGVCKPVVCEGGHLYGALWNIVIPHGTGIRSCSITGQIIEILTICTEKGYMMRDGTCVPAQCGEHRYPETWTTSVAHGHEQHSCSAIGQDSSVLVCDLGYTNINSQCTAVKCGLAEDGQYKTFESAPWWTKIDNGQREKICDANGEMKFTATAPTCSAGFEVNGTTCQAASCNGNAHGSSWTSSISHGVHHYTCSYGKITDKGISCNSGYEVKGGKCEKIRLTFCERNPHHPNCREGPLVPLD